PTRPRSRSPTSSPRSRSRGSREAVHFPASLGRRQRLVAGGVGLGLGFGLPLLLSVVMGAASGELSLLILPLPFLGALWIIQGLAPSGYTLEGGAGHIAAARAT